MAEIETAIIDGSHLDQRIYATLDVSINWKDGRSKEKMTAWGNTVNLSGNSVSVAVEVLPPVGQGITLNVSVGKKEIVSVPATVIRVERDPAKPKAALTVDKNLADWREKVLPAAQRWVMRDLKVNYEGDDWLN